MVVGIFLVCMINTGYRPQVDLGTIVEDYVNRRPNDVLRAATLTVKCRSDLEAQIGRINTAFVSAGRY